MQNIPRQRRGEAVCHPPLPTRRLCRLVSKVQIALIFRGFALNPKMLLNCVEVVGCVGNVSALRLPSTARQILISVGSAQFLAPVLNTAFFPSFMPPVLDGEQWGRIPCKLHRYTAILGNAFISSTHLWRTAKDAEGKTCHNDPQRFPSDPSCRQAAPAQSVLRRL